VALRHETESASSSMMSLMESKLSKYKSFYTDQTSKKYRNAGIQVYLNESDGDMSTFRAARIKPSIGVKQTVRIRYPSKSPNNDRCITQPTDRAKVVGSCKPHSRNSESRVTPTVESRESRNESYLRFNPSSSEMHEDSISLSFIDKMKDLDSLHVGHFE